MQRVFTVLSSALLVAAASAGAQVGVPTAPSTLNLTSTATSGLIFGNPRTSTTGSVTRVVFDLAAGVTYTLNPTFGGLRIDVQGARVLPAVGTDLGTSVTEYRAGGGQATLFTPFPLGLSDGWRASEATLATGARVLIVELGPLLVGGADESLRAAVRATVPTSPEAQAALAQTSETQTSGTQAPVAQTPSAQAPRATAPRAPGAAGSLPIPAPSSLPPGDTVAPGAPPAVSELPNPVSATAGGLSGQVPGRAEPGAVLGAPRIGKGAGQTRVVLELPAGASYQIVPGGVGLRVEVQGVSSAGASAQNLSPEVRAWRLDPAPLGASLTLVTGTPTSAHGGWRAQLLPPAAGSVRSRLVLDLSPALADVTPVPTAERALAQVPRLSTGGGLALLALGATTQKPRVVIDPGHGGRDPGAQGTISEKEVTLAVGLRVRELLQAAGVDVVMTRDADRALSSDKTTDLQMRAGLGTPGTQLFVSIHVNAMEPQNALRGYGVETWWNPNHPLSQQLAGILQQSVVGTTSAYSQGLKSGRSLSVLRNSRIPAALVEIGYTSHPVDGQNLLDTNYLDRVALGIAQGVRQALVTGISASGVGGVGGGGK